MKLALAALAFGALFQARDRPQQGPGAEVGKEAPGFKLKTQDGKSEVELAKLKGKPAVLIFGSYT
jgi:cytochrome oxidase Cu insertion factor (SCO1/SenC/PrrC family)